MPPISSKRSDVSAANKERNEYIPSFIAKKPFYVGDDEHDDNDYLEHQRLQKDSSATDSKWYDRGKKVAPAATKYRKGACENCGSMSHNARDCLSRPRKTGAKWTGKNIQADDLVQDVQLGWDAKRDRWNGYDPAEYAQVVSDYNDLEELRRSTKDVSTRKEKEDERQADEGVRYEEETDMGREQSTATRNLRLREDTAKYLLNLDLDSAKYDPKTRSMVDSGATLDKAAALVAEEGFIKMSGDAAEFEKAQRYAWESQERGDKNKIHLQANPTSGEYLRKKEEQEAAGRKELRQKALLKRYGGQEIFQKTALKDVVVTESERYIEYDEFGSIKGAPKIAAKSKYAEDVHPNNHTSVWGSWWSNFMWGYACCHSTVKNSYCTGDEGRLAYDASSRLKSAEDFAQADDRLSGYSDEQKLNQPSINRPQDPDATAKKRTLEEMKGEITEAETDEYRRKRLQAADPMAGLLGRDELAHSP